MVKNSTAAREPQVPTTNNTHQDGIDHINIWLRGQTRLGRMLSTYFKTPFVHPVFGRFNCMMGFWYYIKTEEKRDELRILIGEEAKRFGKTQTSVKVDNFRDIITVANYHKIEQNKDLKKIFLESTLPFDMYHTWGPAEIIVRPLGHEWQVKMFADLRDLMRAGQVPEDPDYAHVLKRR